MNRFFLLLQWLCEPFTHNYALDNRGLFDTPPDEIEIDDPVEHLERCFLHESKVVIERLRRKDGH
jgi:hypothetical protein